MGEASEHPAGAPDAVGLLIDAAPVAMIMTEPSGRIVLVNAQAERLFGYPRDELLRLVLDQLVPERFRAAHPAKRAGFFADPSSRAMGAGRDLFGLTRDGVEIPIEIGLTPIRTEAGLCAVATVIDISQRKRLELQQREASVHELMVSMLTSIPLALIATHPDGVIRTVNPAAMRLLGYAEAELVGREATTLVDARELAERSRRCDLPGFETMVAAGRSARPGDRDWVWLRSDGEPIPVAVSVTGLHTTQGEPDGYLLVPIDVSEQRRAQQAVEHMSRHDALTGLPNRTMLLSRLADQVRLATDTGEALGLVLLSADGVQRASDSLGPAAGDAVVVELARRVRAAAGEAFVARIGTAVFALIVPGPLPGPGRDDRVRGLVDAITAPVDVDDHLLQISAGVGAAAFPDDAPDGVALLQRAELALRASQEGGRLGIVRFEPEMLESSRTRLELEAALPDAIGNGELHLVFQPQVSLSQRRTVGVETLVRWSRDGVPVSPADFIPVAEESDLILAIGEWTLLEGCRQIAALDGHIRVAINVSPRQFQAAPLAEQVERALRESGLPPERLELEITEGMLMSDPRRSSEVLRGLRKLGVAVALDDFGTGYSSLAYLTRFPVDTLKIDQSFVRRMVTEPGDAAIVDAVIAMAHSLGLSVLAEGVETAMQEEFLRSHGCDVGQGFLYSQGMPAPELADFLAAGR